MLRIKGFSVALLVVVGNVAIILAIALGLVHA